MRIYFNLKTRKSYFYPTPENAVQLCLLSANIYVIIIFFCPGTFTGEFSSQDEWSNKTEKRRGQASVFEYIVSLLRKFDLEKYNFNEIK